MKWEFCGMQTMNGPECKPFMVSLLLRGFSFQHCGGYNSIQGWILLQGETKHFHSKVCVCINSGKIPGSCICTISGKDEVAVGQLGPVQIVFAWLGSEPC